MSNPIRSLANDLTGRTRTFGEKFSQPMLAINGRVDKSSSVSHELTVICETVSGLLVLLFLNPNGGKPLLPHPKTFSREDADRLISEIFLGFYFFAESLEHPRSNEQFFHSELSDGLTRIVPDESAFEYSDDIWDAEDPITRIGTRIFSCCEQGFQRRDPLEVFYEHQLPVQELLVYSAKHAISQF